MHTIATRLFLTLLSFAVFSVSMPIFAQPYSPGALNTADSQVNISKELRTVSSLATLTPHFARLFLLHLAGVQAEYGVRAEQLHLLAIRLHDDRLLLLHALEQVTDLSTRQQLVVLLSELEGDMQVFAMSVINPLEVESFILNADSEVSRLATQLFSNSYKRRIEVLLALAE